MKGDYKEILFIMMRKCLGMEGRRGEEDLFSKGMKLKEESDLLNPVY
jgi:hypothetical protein